MSLEPRCRVRFDPAAKAQTRYSNLCGLGGRIGMKTYFRPLRAVVLLLSLLNVSCDRLERWSSQEMTVTWFDGFTKLQVKAKGQFEFTEDDADIKSISRQGYLLIKE